MQREAVSGRDSEFRVLPCRNTNSLTLKMTYIEGLPVLPLGEPTQL